MKNLLKLFTPNIGVIGAVVGVGLLAICFAYAFGYSKAAKEGKENLEGYKLNVKAVGEAREAQTRQVIASQQQIATEANDEATKLRNALAEHYRNNRVRVPETNNTRSGGMPPVSCPAENVESTSEELELGSLRLKAADDALTILLLQKWVTENAGLR